MTDTETQDSPAGTLWDAPNQQVVRDDASPPWQEGTGGEGTPPGDDPAASQTPSSGDGLDEMTKADLLQMAKDRNISPANNDMTKQELIDAIRAQRTG